MHEKHQDIEDPCEAKVASTVLKTNGTGDSLAEFNQIIVQFLDKISDE